MIVDDRLYTVLQTQAAGRAGLNTQMRQLVDLLGRVPDRAWTDQHDHALGRIDQLHHALGDAASATLIGLCTLRSPRLIAHLTTCGPRTAVAAIARATISDAEWMRLIPALPIHARGALRHRRDLSAPVTGLLERLGIDDFVLSDAAVPAAKSAAPTPAAPDSAPATGNLVSLIPNATRRSDAPAPAGIGAIVRRIEAFRRNRQTEDHVEPGQTRLPFAEDSAAEPLAIAIDVAIDAAGTIIAADGVDPALLVGHTPFVTSGPATAASVDHAALMAFRSRVPIVDGHVLFDGAPRIAGDWRIDAVPRFGADGGQFTGYRARLRRRPRAEANQAAADHATGRAGADVLQQLLHELRTPINAIQGFAELIQQQLLGPTPHHYRSLAASIAADAARMLAGFEDVERMVRIDSGRARIEPGEADLAAIVTQAIAQIEPLIAPREIRLRWAPPAGPSPVALDPAEAERTIWRLLSTLIGAAAPGERLSLSLDHSHDGTKARLVMTLPAALARQDDHALFAPDIARGGGSSVGMLGHGFALGLVAAEVRSAGGQLVRPGEPGAAILELSLPLLMPVMLDRFHVAS